MLAAEGGIAPRGESCIFVDGIVIGRRTFETVLTFDAWPYGTKPVVVLSSNPSTLRAPDGAVCDLMTGTPHEIVARLSAPGTKHVYVDGGVTIQKFLESGLIQRVIITRIPVLLGGGIPSLDRGVRAGYVHFVPPKPSYMPVGTPSCGCRALSARASRLRPRPVA